MKKNFAVFIACLGALGMAACDLQPKIMALPDSVGDFISDRYPALLADPNSEPEIYNSAASDYGVYASPELYGSVESDDYILYADINDYMFPAQMPDTDTQAQLNAASKTGDDNANLENAHVTKDTVLPDIGSAEKEDILSVPVYGGVDDAHVITVARGETLYTVARRYGMSVNDIAALNKIEPPYNIRAGQQIRVPGNGDITVSADTLNIPSKLPTPIVQSVVTAPKDVASSVVRPATPAKVELKDVTVGPGDTLYSISRAYSVPVNDLAVMNDLSAPFKLTVGQKVKVPNLQAAAARVTPVVPKTAVIPEKNTETKPVAPAPGKVAAKPAEAKKTKAEPVDVKKPAVAAKKKISSDPKQKLPSIAARSSSKFSWPVRGKILSHFGAKSNGLFNDGINIGAARGTPVKAAENGVVAYAGNEVKGMGNLVIIQHSGGWMTVYAHMNSMAVRRGSRVSVGQKIGTIGTTGKVDRPQLHFEIRKGTKAYNPSSYLKN